MKKVKDSCYLPFSIVDIDIHSDKLRVMDALFHCQQPKTELSYQSMHINFKKKYTTAILCRIIRFLLYIAPQVMVRLGCVLYYGDSWYRWNLSPRTRTSRYLDEVPNIIMKGLV